MRRKAVIKALRITHFCFTFAIKWYQLFNCFLEKVERQDGLSSSTGMKKELHFIHLMVKRISLVLKALILKDPDSVCIP